MKVYLCGPMTGLPEFNFPAFAAAAADLRAWGYEVANPAENYDGRTDLPVADYFKADLPQVCDADAVVVLPGWRESKGALIETGLAQHLGKPILDYLSMEGGEMVSAHESAAEEAHRLVHGNRGVNYGHPIDDFARTGRMWGAILGVDDIDPAKVGLCMAAVKISREVNRPNRDNRVDLAGYAETVEMIARRRSGHE